MFIIMLIALIAIVSPELYVTRNNLSKLLYKNEIDDSTQDNVMETKEEDSIEYLDSEEPMSDEAAREEAERLLRSING